MKYPSWFENTEQNKETENNKNSSHYNKKNIMKVIIFEYLYPFKSQKFRTKYLISILSFILVNKNNFYSISF